MFVWLRGSLVGFCTVISKIDSIIAELVGNCYGYPCVCREILSKPKSAKVSTALWRLGFIAVRRLHWAFNSIELRKSAFSKIYKFHPSLNPLNITYPFERQTDHSTTRISIAIYVMLLTQSTTFLLLPSVWTLPTEPTTLSIPLATISSTMCLLVKYNRTSSSTAAS